MADAPPGSLGRFGIMAARLLNFPEVTNILNQILALGGNVLLGGLLIAAGFLRANIMVSIVGAGTAAIVICWASIVLFIAMGLKYMGLVDSIIITAFGAVVYIAALWPLRRSSVATRGLPCLPYLAAFGRIGLRLWARCRSTADPGGDLWAGIGAHGHAVHRAR
ncbi:hypothetical protein [Paeniglutamicibacter gangotriensis]|nr:hypothetical protein [Paeniglutamicibacter gangotriensis]